jgi:hypothetical protein
LTTMILASRTEPFSAAADDSAPAASNGRPVNKFTTLPAGFANRQALVTRHVPKSFVILTRSAPKTDPENRTSLRKHCASRLRCHSCRYQIAKEQTAK